MTVLATEAKVAVLVMQAIRDSVDYLPEQNC